MNKLLISIYLLLLSASLFAEIPAHEVQALTDLYQSTNGSNWNQKWDFSQDTEQLAGVTVRDGHVIAIRMLFNNMEGPLPQSLSQLTELRTLELSFNKLSGELPEALGNLPNLEVLALNGNNLTGNIPRSFGNLSMLKQLHLSSNQLAGELPESLSNLNQLEVFNVFDNDLNGAIPLGIAQNRNLKDLMIAQNQFDNSNEVSAILLSKSGQLNLNDNPTVPSTKTVIAIESSDDEN